MKQFYKLFIQQTLKGKYLKNTMFGFTLLLVSCNILNAQVSTYSFAQSSGTYTPITGTILGTATGNTPATNLNSNVYPMTLPFNFNFNGTLYSSINVSTNGFITFGAAIPSATNVTPISSTAGYDGAVSAFGRDINSVFDINSTTSSISWESVGTVPNREIVIQWRNFRPISSNVTTAAYVFSFQIRLKETSNVISMVYNSGVSLVGSTSNSGASQIGLRGNTFADFNNRLNTTTLEFINSTPGTASTSAQNFSTSNAIPGMPTAGLTYTWTPSILGTSERESKTSLEIYPNPFNEVINISDTEKITSVSVINLSGRVLKIINNVSSLINLSDLKTGVYILNILYKDNTISSHKIIKK